MHLMMTSNQQSMDIASQRTYEMADILQVIQRNQPM
uniref:Uncharacterized protein n=1 Tax=Arundo donax TaxID=35708 RepID=A0A0A9F4T1_ARUDO